MRGVKGTRKHGTLSQYTGGCYCPPCKTAGTRANKQYHHRIAQGWTAYTDATGTRRRLQGLAAIGHSFVSIGAELGVTGQAVSRILQEPRVTTRTADRVKDVTARLGRTRGSSTITARRAAKAAWVSLYCWDDDTIDDPTAVPVGAGWTPGRTDWDDLASVAASVEDAAARVGMTRRALERAAYREGRADVLARFRAAA